MIDRLEGRAKGRDNIFGVSPGYDEINWNGLNFTEQQFQQVMHIDPVAWREELKLHEALFAQLAYHLPAELPATQAAMASRLAA